MSKYGAISTETPARRFRCWNCQRLKVCLLVHCKGQRERVRVCWHCLDLDDQGALERSHRC